MLAGWLWEVVLREGGFYSSSEAERIRTMRNAPHAESLVLDCECGEKMVIFGQVEDWLSRDPVFRCVCGKRLTFSNDTKEEYYKSKASFSELANL